LLDGQERPVGGGPTTSLRPVLLAWVMLSTLTQIPYLRAWLSPPTGTSFVGFFYYVDDQYNYLSYVEQAERGAFFFENKLVLEPHGPALVNLEWWLVGRLSALLGSRPFLAYRFLAFGAAFALLAGLDRCFRSAGIASSHRFAALLLIGLGGGLGGLLWRLGLLPLPEALDLTTGAFPFIELLANPHFVLGTALLVWALWRLTTAATLREHAHGVVLATILGLVRPYDLLLLALVRGLGVLAFEPRSRWTPSFVALLGLGPVAAYNAWVFYGLPFYGSFGLTYVPPRLEALGIALGPAVALAVLAAGGARSSEVGRRVKGHLALWATLALAIVVFRPVGFALQFLVGAGLPLLGLGALWLSRLPRSLTLLTTGLLCPTAGIALGLVLFPNPRWYAPIERLAAVDSLRPLCRPGDILMAPPDIGLLAIGRTSCKAYVSHVVAPDHEKRVATTFRFYGDMSPAARSALLSELGVTRLVLPGDAGLIPVDWLGPTTGFRRQAIQGHGPALSLYAIRWSGLTSLD